MQRTPVSLLERLRQPNAEAAWTRFVELYTPLLYFWARRRLGLRNPEAGDLVQDVFVLLLKALPDFTYDPKKSFRGWLRTVLINQCRKNYAKQQKLKERSGAALPDLPVESIPFEEEEYRQRLVRRALELMQAEFQPVTWQACWKYVVEDRPVADVAAELGISTNAVYLAKSRVLRRLRQELQGLLD